MAGNSTKKDADLDSRNRGKNSLPVCVPSTRRLTNGSDRWASLASYSGYLASTAKFDAAA
jgi:hypothetical protein